MELQELIEKLKNISPYTAETLASKDIQTTDDFFKVLSDISPYTAELLKK